MVGVVQTLYGARMRAVRLQARYQPLLEAIPVLAQVAVLALGGWLALQGQITLGTFLAFSTYVAQFVAPPGSSPGVLTVGQQARAGVERIFQLLDLEPGSRTPPTPSSCPSSRGEIELERRARSATHEHAVLDGLDLHVRAGRARGPRRRQRQRQVDGHPARPPASRPRRGRRSSSTGTTSAT